VVVQRVTTGLSRGNNLAQDIISKTEQAGVAAALYNGVMKVQGSKLGRDSDRIFVSLVVPASRCQDNAAPDWGDDRLLPNTPRFSIHLSSIVCVIKSTRTFHEFGFLSVQLACALLLGPLTLLGSSDPIEG
jgi:hypothetical protein